MKPLLACNYNESKLVFPLGAQAKIDGVRGLTTEGGLTGRSLKKHKNKHTTAFYSGKEYRNLDGELAAASEVDPDLCRVTSSALSTITGTPYTIWHLFDCLDKNVVGGDYVDRHAYLVSYIKDQHAQGLCLNARVVPMTICKNLEELLACDEKWLAMGYEGTIIRALHGKHKEGRSTVTKGELLRIKRFADAEAVVVSLEEGESNNNEAQTNELGRTFRTSHIENKVLNGTLGNMQCDMLNDVEYEGRIILTKGQRITVSPGTMLHPMRKHYFENQKEILGHIVTFKYFPKGIKDKPRFPVFKSLRSSEDISE